MRSVVFVGWLVGWLVDVFVSVLVGQFASYERSVSHFALAVTVYIKYMKATTTTLLSTTALCRLEFIH